MSALKVNSYPFFNFRKCCALAWLALLPTLAVAQDSGASAKRIAATIDVTKTSAPVSPYLYGQFIEHIADTVNRSVWAEMIDDRKFYFPIDSKTPAPAASRGRQPNPWRPIGPDESVVMDHEHAYTGEHSPLVMLDVTAPHGIVQAGVVLKKGRAYSGRVVLAGDDGAHVTVSLVWGSGANDRQTVPIKRLKSDYSKFPLSFTAGETVTNGRIEIAGMGKGVFRIGAVSLMPADNNRGFRVDTIALLKAQHSGMYRWPGGNFLSAHEWRDAIGDMDKRPPKWDPVWNTSRARLTRPWASCARPMAIPPPTRSSGGESAMRCGATSSLATWPRNNTSLSTTCSARPCARWIPPSNWSATATRPVWPTF
jgi:alpha-N-arabinofuranosidase